VLLEAGLQADLEQVDLKTKRTKSNADFTAINPKGQVPALVWMTARCSPRDRRSSSTSPT
jgi:glutathione S-transferase